MLSHYLEAVVVSEGVARLNHSNGGVTPNMKLDGRDRLQAGGTIHTWLVW